MRRRFLAGWRGSARALGGALSELVRAELAALGDDFSRSGRRLGGGLLLIASALFVLFWAIGLTVYLAVEIAGLWLPRWGAVAAVLAVAVLLMAGLAALGRRRLRQLEAPAAMLERRWSSHRDWWLEQFPAAGSASAARDAAAVDSPEDAEPPDESG